MYVYMCSKERLYNQACFKIKENNPLWATAGSREISRSEMDRIRIDNAICELSSETVR